jgi:hypothetical protein
MADCYSGKGSGDFYGQADYYGCLVTVPSKSGLSCSSAYPLLKICHLSGIATDKVMGRLEFAKDFWSLDSKRSGNRV